ncbi:hypothetical protein ABT097_00880 [Streptomyces sp. NPDC002225]|uniref:hypothetical protein n=1 Tax=Streptomyces sp. NPDC002225 TaxID=3154413 RepID=UPI003332021B
MDLLIAAFPTLRTIWEAARLPTPPQADGESDTGHKTHEIRTPPYMGLGIVQGAESGEDIWVSDRLHTGP